MSSAMIASTTSTVSREGSMYSTVPRAALPETLQGSTVPGAQVHTSHALAASGSSATISVDPITTADSRARFLVIRTPPLDRS